MIEVDVLVLSTEKGEGLIVKEKGVRRRSEEDWERRRTELEEGRLSEEED